MTPKTAIPSAQVSSLLKALAIAAAVFWIFYPALHGDWLWDDDHLIVGNDQLRTFGGLWKIWFEPGSHPDYYPIEETVLWLEWHLWQNDTLGYHWLNIILHFVNALLVWRLFDKLGIRFAWLGGFLFAIHPVQVESVAWMSELKNTLSLPPILLAMSAWIDFERGGKRSDYLLALGLFLVAMLCKITVVMFPVVILLYAWWKRGRIGFNDLKNSAPFFVLALAVGLITILSGLWNRLFGHLGPACVPEGGAAGRLLLAGSEIAFYFSKCVLPVDLLPVYPKWTISLSSPAQYLPWAVLIAVFGWLWTKRESWGRPALLGLGFFAINLTPCPGFIPTPNMAYAWVMDHFLYLPIIGLLGLAVAGMGEVEKQLVRPLQKVGVGVISLIAVLLMWESHGYAALYVNQETLWTYTLQRNPEAWPAHNNLGNLRLRTGHVEEAIEHFHQALRIDPQLDEAHNNLGNALLDKGEYSKAIVEFETAIKINPNYATAHNGLGNALVLIGRAEEALAQYQEALRLDPDYPEAHNGVANILLQSGHLLEAKAECEEALRYRPNYTEAHCNLGLILAQQGQIAEAIEEFETAQKLNPSDARIQQELDSLRALQQGAGH